MTYYSCGWLIDNRRFLQLRALTLYFSPSSGLPCMNEQWNRGYLFFKTSTAKALSCTNYEIIIQTIIPPETLLQLQ
jgi:hypothetical protein